MIPQTQTNPLYTTGPGFNKGYVQGLDSRLANLFQAFLKVQTQVAAINTKSSRNKM